MIYAEYWIQPDDVNHLVIIDNDITVYNVRVKGSELHMLIRGNAGFVKDEWYYAKDYREIAKLFRNNKIEYIVFRNYAGVHPRFSFTVKPPYTKNIHIRTLGLFTTEYWITTENGEKIIISVGDNKVAILR